MPDLVSWLDEISAMSPLGFAVVAFAGLTMGVAPSSLPLYSIIVGYVTSPEAYWFSRPGWRRGHPQAG